MPFFRDLLTQMNELLAQQSATRKIIAFVILLAVIGFGAAQLMKYGKAIEYEVLYAGLDAESAKTLTDAIKTSAPQTPHQVSQDERGWTIKVPSDRVLDLRLELAPNIQAGGGRVGWELFDRNSIGVTDFTQKINRQRATQGELERTIQSIDVVKMAKVKLAIPEESLFVRDEDKPKASVFVELYPKSILSKSKVEAIQSLVSGSIEGLTKDNVTVVDASGRLLSKANGEEEDEEAGLDARAILVDQQEKQRKEYERYLEQKIETSLSKVFGPQHVSAQVNVDFDFTVKEMSELKYNPKNVPLSESISRSNQVTNSIGTGGVAGASAHIPPDGGTSGSVATVSSTPMSTEQTITNYNVGKTETKTVYPPSEIRRITAAVLVDHLPVEKRDKDGKVTEVTRQKLQPAELTDIEEQVKQIINFSEERPGGLGDMVKISQMAFRMPEEMTPEETFTKMKQQHLIVVGIKYGLLGLAALLLIFFVIRPLMNVVAPRPLAPAALGPGGMEALLPAPGEERAFLEGPAEQPAVEDTGENAGLLSMSGGEDMDEIAQRQVFLDKEILELAKSNPKKVSTVLRAWIES